MSSAPTADEALDRALRERFALEALRPWQREAILALLGEPGRVLVVAPTGGGKSLTYQLPAVLLGGVTLVVSPLISLMEDQVRALDARGIPATFLASTLPPDERGERVRGLRAGKYTLVYLAPERLADPGFVDLLARCDVSMLAIDEAHCIVQWGHDFRPDYQRLGGVVERLRPRRLLACTATANEESRAEILAQLGMDPERTRVVLRGFARPNLALEVEQVEGPREATAYVLAELSGSIGAPRAPTGGAIVYAATRATTEKLAAKLVERGWDALAYHAGMPGEQRTAVQRRFSDRMLPVVVATNAFGMGIDRPDVRVVVHAQPSASIEAYYQEVGRAGRDGAPARGLLLVSPGDIAIRRRLCEGGADDEAGAEQAARAWRQFRELLRYVDARSCRHDFILRFFGDEAESLGGCGRCDVCRDVDAAERESPELLAAESLVVRKALAGVARGRRRGGMQAIAEMLRGDDTERVRRFGFDALSTYGLLRERSQDDVMGILRALLAAGWIDLTAGEFPLPYITASGMRVLREEEPVRIRLPKRRGKRPAALAKSRSKGARPRAAADAPPGGALFDALRDKRAALAREAGVPAYVVAHDRALAAIAEARPTTAEELEDVPGFGPAKIARWGEPLLEVVRSRS